jgi:NADH-quinone oxidoreductase subunit J
MTNIFIYFTCVVIVVAALQVIFAKNPVHSVILLVLVFLQTAVLFILLGAEFLAILLVTVYIGAIAILFLFVVMLLNVRVVEIYSSLQYHVPIGALAGLCFGALLALVCVHEFKSFMFVLHGLQFDHLEFNLFL